MNIHVLHIYNTFLRSTLTITTVLLLLFETHKTFTQKYSTQSAFQVSLNATEVQYHYNIES